MEINISLLAGSALANGLNPCGIGLLITFLGYLSMMGGNGDKGKSVLKNGLVYIAAVFVTYMLLGMVFYGAAYYLQRMWIASVFRVLIAGVMMVFGLIQIKDVFWPDSPIHLKMSLGGFMKLTGLMGRASLPISFLIGVFTVILSSPCMLPLYAGTVAVIARSGLGILTVLSLFLFYNLVFVSPLLIVMWLFVRGRSVIEMKELEHKYQKIGRFALGLFLIGVGIWIGIN